MIKFSTVLSRYRIIQIRFRVGDTWAASIACVIHYENSKIAVVCIYAYNEEEHDRYIEWKIFFFILEEKINFDAMKMMEESSEKSYFNNVIMSFQWGFLSIDR